MLLINSLIGLAGCTEKTAKSKHLEGKVTEPQMQLDKKPRGEPKKEEKQKPIVVNVVDPNTKGIVRTFNPVDIGYGTDNEKYKQEIEMWAKDLARGTATTTGYDQRMVLDKLDANGQIIRGKPKIILEEAELVAKVIEASAVAGDIELPLYLSKVSINLRTLPI